jgi:hypothetical protein
MLSEQPQPYRTLQRSDRQQPPQRPADRVRFRPFRRRHGLLAIPIAGMRKEAASRPAAARVGAIAPIGEQIALRLRHIGVALRIGQERDKQNRSRRASSAPEACSPRRHRAKSYEALPPAKEGSGAPKGALSNQCPRQARLRAALWRRAAFRRSRLRHSPPASTPMAQLQNRVSRGFD